MILYYQWAKHSDQRRQEPLEHEGEEERIHRNGSGSPSKTKVECIANQVDHSQQVNESQYLKYRSMFIEHVKRGQVKGLEIADDIVKGGLIISVKGGKYEIEERESYQMLENEEDFFENYQSDLTREKWSTD